ncbi:hypothetical protein ACOJUR_14865 [Alicyclobacillus tolerans]|uniref:Uncharacterized protein n=2 Tax=Alicyclobacillus tolerans TaxID=90970 RepID=A0A1M6N526_9BACL|nr:MULTISPECIES: hypothetical protein [Alicyclobacillus]MDP9728050.1 hypothetical protein [Alicyclobacillus tengchongensis]QRF24330.1 hypothetical protein FY534_12370 [Alicyclobacillus sp. TC]SHJ90810.1 hypothetical protein SAMN05443507_10584 [Alicyclobacillus montanus]
MNRLRWRKTRRGHHYRRKIGKRTRVAVAGLLSLVVIGGCVRLVQAVEGGNLYSASQGAELSRIREAANHSHLANVLLPNGKIGLGDFQSVSADGGGILTLNYADYVVYESNHSLVLDSPDMVEHLGPMETAQTVDWETFQTPNQPTRHALFIQYQNGQNILVIVRNPSENWGLEDIQSFVQNLTPLT